MSEDPADRARRNRLVGRVVIVILGLLLAAYIIVTFWGG